MKGGIDGRKGERIGRKMHYNELVEDLKSFIDRKQRGNGTNFS